MDISQPLIVFDTARFTQENRGRKGGGLFLIFFFFQISNYLKVHSYGVAWNCSSSGYMDGTFRLITVEQEKVSVSSDFSILFPRDNTMLHVVCRDITWQFTVAK